MESSYFDEGLSPLRFFDTRRGFRPPVGGTNSVLVSDATGKSFYILLSHSFIRKTLFTPEKAKENFENS